MAEMQPETKRRPKMPEPVKVSDLIRHVFAPIPRMPRGVQQVYDKLGIYRPELYSSFVEGSEPPLCFTDRYGDEVIVPTSKKGVPYFHEGYIEALWDFKNGNLLLEEASHGQGHHSVPSRRVQRLRTTRHLACDRQHRRRVTASKSRNSFKSGMRSSCARRNA
ncbi:MAG: hypothetical protein ACLRL4_10475 [Bifidobacterium bifidum]